MNAYAVALTREGDDIVVSVRDLPEVCTSGDDEAEALSLAADAIAAIVEHRMAKDQPLPAPSPAQPGEHLVALPAPLAAKAAVYGAWRASGMKKTELARLLGRSETEVRRILDPRYGTKLDQLDEAARALGGRLAVGFVSAG